MDSSLQAVIKASTEKSSHEKTVEQFCKLCFLVHCFQNCFCFSSTTFPSLAGTFCQRLLVLHCYNWIGDNFWLGGPIDPRSMPLGENKDNYVTSEPRCITWEHANYVFLPVQVENLFPTNPSQIAAARVGWVQDENKIPCWLSGRLEGNTGNLVGDVVHRPSHNFPVDGGKGMIKAIFNCPAGPFPVRIGKECIQWGWVSKVKVARNDVAFNKCWPTHLLPPITRLMGCKTVIL